jgi:hypothetical protein
LCRQLGLNTEPSNVLDALRQVPLDDLLEAVSGMGPLSTFRGVCDEDGSVADDLMYYQKSGQLASSLRQAGVKCLIVGDVNDEVSEMRLPSRDPSDSRPR